MPESEIPLNFFFASEQPSAARVPHIITAFDSELLGALVHVNGAKPGVWHAAAPYDENDSYQPFRENLALSAWSLAYNQGELLELAGYTNTLVFGNDTIIVDSAADEKMLLEVEATLGEGSYADLPDFPNLLQKIGWAIMAVGADKHHALVLVSEAKRSYLDMLQHWCHDHGRSFYTISGATLRAWPAPADARQRLIFEQGSQFLTKLSHFGISADEAHEHLGELIQRVKEHTES